MADLWSIWSGCETPEDIARRRNELLSPDKWGHLRIPYPNEMPEASESIGLSTRDAVGTIWRNVHVYSRYRAHLEDGVLYASKTHGEFPLTTALFWTRDGVSFVRSIVRVDHLDVATRREWYLARIRFVSRRLTRKMRHLDDYRNRDPDSVSCYSGNLRIREQEVEKVREDLERARESLREFDERYDQKTKTNEINRGLPGGEQAVLF